MRVYSGIGGVAPNAESGIVPRAIIVDSTRRGKRFLQNYRDLWMQAIAKKDVRTKIP